MSFNPELNSHCLMPCAPTCPPPMVSTCNQPTWGNCGTMVYPSPVVNYPWSILGPCPRTGGMDSTAPVWPGCPPPSPGGQCWAIRNRPC